jgi:hypothetical protein
MDPLFNHFLPQIESLSMKQFHDLVFIGYMHPDKAIMNQMKKSVPFFSDKINSEEDFALFTKILLLILRKEENTDLEVFEFFNESSLKEFLKKANTWNDHDWRVDIFQLVSYLKSDWSTKLLIQLNHQILKRINNLTPKAYLHYFLVLGSFLNNEMKSTYSGKLPFEEYLSKLKPNMKKLESLFPSISFLQMLEKTNLPQEWFLQKLGPEIHILADEILNILQSPVFQYFPKTLNTLANIFLKSMANNIHKEEYCSMLLIFPIMFEYFNEKNLHVTIMSMADNLVYVRSVLYRYKKLYKEVGLEFSEKSLMDLRETSLKNIDPKKLKENFESINAYLEVKNDYPQIPINELYIVFMNLFSNVFSVNYFLFHLMKKQPGHPSLNDCFKLSLSLLNFLCDMGCKIFKETRDLSVSKRLGVLNKKFEKGEDVKGELEGLIELKEVKDELNEIMKEYMEVYNQEMADILETDNPGCISSNDSKFKLENPRYSSLFTLYKFNN